ncbi:hypothetical protein CPB84DRAFT_1796619 [Gymnopilus junonius]|uniref:Uncharacterized protein n=1 Tax=Gymnopilus junonius TaxID=109634 RepID=A0A9P5NCB3_GYMJU|nr:hypothetical protein CPB84DRAFT_1796619 [Gymnopilus junonius]
MLLLTCRENNRTVAGFCTGFLIAGKKKECTKLQLNPLFSSSIPGLYHFIIAEGTVFTLEVICNF